MTALKTQTDVQARLGQADAKAPAALLRGATTGTVAVGQRESVVGRDAAPLATLPVVATGIADNLALDAIGDRLTRAKDVVSRRRRTVRAAIPRSTVYVARARRKAPPLDADTARPALWRLLAESGAVPVRRMRVAAAVSPLGQVGTIADPTNHMGRETRAAGHAVAKYEHHVGARRVLRACERHQTEGAEHRTKQWA
ncbi:MAG: hypothetical protein JWN48_953 [Myxococcaceae bacterium]|nr:hypothetical protein [Myxococcaceae bacterium]